MRGAGRASFPFPGASIMALNSLGISLVAASKRLAASTPDVAATPTATPTAFLKQLSNKYNR